MRRIVVGLFALLFVGVVVLTDTVSAQAKKEDRVSGTIQRSNKDQSTLTVRTGRGNVERIVVYDSSTKWTKGTKRETAMASDFKDGSRVIALGKFDDKTRLVATEINLRAPR